MIGKDLRKIVAALLDEEGASTERLAKLTGLSPPQVEAGLELLNKAGYAEVTNIEDLRYRSTTD